MAAMQNWEVNLERKKNSTVLAKKSAGWDDLSEFEAFSTDVPWCPLEFPPDRLGVSCGRVECCGKYNWNAWE